MKIDPSNSPVEKPKTKPYVWVLGALFAWFMYGAVVQSVAPDSATSELGGFADKAERIVAD